MTPEVAARRARRATWRDADAAGRARLVAQLIREGGEETGPALALARMDVAALRSGAEAVLAERPDHKPALRIAAWCLNRTGDFRAARDRLRRLLADGAPRRDDSLRELLRLDLLDPPPDDTAWQAAAGRHGTLSDLSYAVQRGLSLGEPTDAAALEAAIAEARDTGLAQTATQPRAAAVVARIAGAPSVALVGNGPSVTGRGMGAAIDAHDLVVRFNYPVLTGFAADVGQRTDVIVFSAAKRPKLAELMAREPGFAAIPALAIESAGAPGTDPPAIPPALMRSVVHLGYGRPTTGFATILLVSLLLDRPATLYGFDFFPPSTPGHYFGAAAAAASHETAYERWFVQQVLPHLRSHLRVADG